jgi:hypothetical protein
MTASQKLGEKMYADMQAARRRRRRQWCGARPQVPASAKPADDNVVDAESRKSRRVSSPGAPAPDPPRLKDSAPGIFSAAFLLKVS